LSGKLNDDELDDVEKEFDDMFHVELPEAPDDELEAVKEAAGIKKGRILHLMLNYFSLVSGRKKERVAAT
jgi:hypothetical protein